MAALPERQTSAFALWARAVARFALVLFVTASLGHRYGFVETIGFFWILGLVVLLAILALVLAAGGFVHLWERGHRAGKASLGASVIALMVLSPFLLAAVNVVRYPALTDISTDLVEPPRFTVARGLRDAAMNPIVLPSQENLDIQAQAYPKVTGRRLDASMERALAAAVAVIAANGWVPHQRVPGEAASGEMSIEVFAPTFLMHYPVDAVIRLTDEGESTFVDMRMNSRYGRHDLGDGARRIRRFMTDLDAEFERQSLQIIDIPELPEDEDAVD